MSRLKGKIVIINTLFAFIISTVLLFIIYFSLYTASKNYILNIMGRELYDDTSVREQHKPEKNSFLNFPYGFNGFSLTIDYDGNILENTSENTFTSEDINQILNKEKRAEILLNNTSYSFLKEKNNSTIRIIFYNRTPMLLYLKNLAYLFIAFESVFIFIFIFLSYVISLWITKPIEKNIQKQKEFISNAAHELKTPITIASLNTDLAIDTNLDTTNTTRLYTIKEQMEHMKHLVHTLLSLSRLDELNHNKKVLAPINISELTTALSLSYEALIYEEGKHLKLNIADHVLHKIAPSDYTKLLNIFLENALKYCDYQGEISIRLTKSSLCISNHFTGQTIDTTSIFDRFYKGSHDSTSFGLGLAMAKEISNLYGYTLRCIHNDHHVYFYILF